MDQIKIGKFISEMRKAKNLTQKQLAEQINISDKAVSKWECGKSLPDNSILLDLCRVLEINVNELLSGEKLTHDNYHGKAEENIMNLMNENTKNNRHSRLALISSYIALGIVFILLIISINGSIYAFLDAASLLSIIIPTLLILLASGSTKDFFSSFAICFTKKNDYSEKEILQASKALKLAAISIVISGIISTLLCIIVLCTYELDAKSLAPNIAVSLLSILYSFIIIIFMLPLQKRLQDKMAE